MLKSLKFVFLMLVSVGASVVAKESELMLEKEVGHVFATPAHTGLAPSQRLHLILLGVDDVAIASAFYERLGWHKSPTGHAGFVKFDLGGYALCLLPRADLATDALASSSETPAFAGVAFVHLVRTPEEVPQLLARAVAAGGSLVKPATRTPWGIAGYFKDPDGYLFEVDYEKPWVLDDDQRLVVDKLNP